MSGPTKRILALRENVFKKNDPVIRSAEGELLWYRSWLHHSDCGSSMVRRARTKAYMLANSTPV